MCDRFKLEKHTLCSQSHAVLYYQINPDLASHCLNVNMTATHLHRSTNFRKGPFKLRNAIGGWVFVLGFLGVTKIYDLILRGGGGCQISRKQPLRNTRMAP